MNRRNPVTRKNQQGAVLIATLMILLLMTIFGISTMETNILEEKMANNMRERNTAFQAAETALRACEGYIGSLDVLPDISTDGHTSIWDNKSPDPDKENNQPWWNEWGKADWESVSRPANAVIDLGDTINSKVVGETLSDVLGLLREPQCLIEKLWPLKEGVEAGMSLAGADTYLQITARGTSVSGKSVVMLQSVHKW